MYKLKIFGIIASGVFIAYAILSIIIAAVDRFYSKPRKNAKTDYKFLLDIEIARLGVTNDNILVYSSQLLNKQVIPTYRQVVQTIPKMLPVRQTFVPIQPQNQVQVVQTVDPLYQL